MLDPSVRPAPFAQCVSRLPPPAAWSWALRFVPVGSVANWPPWHSMSCRPESASHRSWLPCELLALLFVVPWKAHKYLPFIGIDIRNPERSIFVLYSETGPILIRRKPERLLDPPGFFLRGALGHPSGFIPRWAPWAWSGKSWKRIRSYPPIVKTLMTSAGSTKSLLTGQVLATHPMGVAPVDTVAPPPVSEASLAVICFDNWPRKSINARGSNPRNLTISRRTPSGIGNLMNGGLPLKDTMNFHCSLRHPIVGVGAT